MKYPPFADLCQFGFVGREEAAVRDAAYTCLKKLHGLVTGPYAGLPMIALDPMPAVVSRVAGKYRYKLLVKTVNCTQLRRLLAELLTDLGREAQKRDVRIFADIDPAGSL